jgi:hypothetical protein
MRLDVCIGVVLAACALIAGCGGSAASPADRTAQANRQKATTVAAELLREARPPDTHDIAMSDLAKNKQEGLTLPFGWLQVASMVDQDELWRTSSSPAAAVESAVSQLPRGARQLQRAEGGGEFLAYYRLPATDRRSLTTTEVSIQAVEESIGTAVRIDAEVAYIALRPQNLRIPSSARVLDITVGSNLKRPLLSLKVTSIPEIRRIADMVNMLPFNASLKGAVYSCPAILTTTPVDTFAFRRSTTGPVLATLIESAMTPTTADPCGATKLVIRGRHEGDLQDGGRLLTQAGALLDVRLSR